MRHVILTVTLLSIIAILACERTATSSTSQDDHDHEHAEHPLADLTEAICVLTSTEGNSAKGWVRFREGDGEVTITAEVTGLEPNSVHAIHIHEFGDLTSADGTSAGGHYNPEGHEHGLPDEPASSRHAGDFGNLEADSEGAARLEITVDNISIGGTMNPIIGRGMIVHADPDDGGQPTGNAGARIAQGVIGVANTM